MDLTKVYRYTLLKKTERRLLVPAMGELILMVLMLFCIIVIMSLIKVC
jgi:hypothetical protein